MLIIFNKPGVKRGDALVRDDATCNAAELHLIFLSICNATTIYTSIIITSTMCTVIICTTTIYTRISITSMIITNTTCTDIIYTRNICTSDFLTQSRIQCAVV